MIIYCNCIVVIPIEAHESKYYVSGLKKYNKFTVISKLVVGSLTKLLMRV